MDIIKQNVRPARGRTLFGSRAHLTPVGHDGLENVLGRTAVEPVDMLLARQLGRGHERDQPQLMNPSQKEFGIDPHNTVEARIHHSSLPLVIREVSEEAEGLFNLNHRPEREDHGAWLALMDSQRTSLKPRLFLLRDVLLDQTRPRNDTRSRSFCKAH